MDFNRYPGSKGAEGVWQRIISEMPPHSTYIEAFLGSGVILRRKRPAAITVGIDADRDVCRVWQSAAGIAGNGERAGCTVINGDARSILAGWTWRGSCLTW